MIDLNDRDLPISKHNLIEELTSMNIEPRICNGLFGYTRTEVNFAFQRVLDKYELHVKEGKMTQANTEVSLQEHFYTKKEASKILKVSEQKIDRLRKGGFLKDTKGTNDKGKVLITRSELERYISTLN